MGETIEDMHKKTELEDKTIILLTDKMGISHQETEKKCKK